jgi:hypothetical protein
MTGDSKHFQIFIGDLYLFFWEWSAFPQLTNTLPLLWLSQIAQSICFYCLLILNHQQWGSSNKEINLIKHDACLKCQGETPLDYKYTL